MARYILISFEDNNEAEDFVNSALDKGILVVGGRTGTSQWRVYPDVWGMYFKPTQFCECPQPGPKQSRGARYGLWIDACGKPIRGHTQHPRNLLLAQEVLLKLEPLDRISHTVSAREGINHTHIPITSLPES